MHHSPALSFFFLSLSLSLSYSLSFYLFSFVSPCDSFSFSLFPSFTLPHSHFFFSLLFSLFLFCSPMVSLSFFLSFPLFPSLSFSLPLYFFWVFLKIALAVLHLTLQTKLTSISELHLPLPFKSWDSRCAPSLPSPSLGFLMRHLTCKNRRKVVCAKIRYFLKIKIKIVSLLCYACNKSTTNQASWNLKFLLSPYVAESVKSDLLSCNKEF